MWIMLAVTIVSTSLAPVCVGQEYRKGDEVIVRRDAPLKVETETVGTVRNGDRLVVEDVRGKWLWVRSGQTRGWIESDSVTAAGAPPAPGQQRHRLQGKRVAIYNLVGNVEVVAGSGPDVLVEVRREGRDSHLIRVAAGPIDGRETLRFIYPADRIVYRRVSPLTMSQVQVREDGTFEGSDGHQVLISGAAPGFEAYADLTVRVPPGHDVSVHVGFGELSARDVESQLCLHNLAGNIQASGNRGSLTIEAGAGDVKTRRVEGSLAIHAKAGNVEARDIQGPVNIHAEAGNVKLAELRARTIELKAEAGQVDMTNASEAENLTIEAQAGDVHLSQIRAKKLQLTAEAGGVGVEKQCNIDDLSIRAEAGDVRLADLRARKVDVKAEAGTVRVQLMSNAEDIGIIAEAGDVAVDVPNDIGAAVELDADAGQIEVKLPISTSVNTDNKVRGTVGNGRGRIKIRTEAGSIRLSGHGTSGGSQPPADSPRSSEGSRKPHPPAPPAAPTPPRPPRFPANLADVGSLPGMPEGLEEAMKEIENAREELGRGNTKGFEEKMRAFEKKMKAIQEKMKASGDNREDSKPQGRPPLGVPPAPPAPPSPAPAPSR